MKVIEDSGLRVKRITVLNTKGGCGKSTLCTNLSTLFADAGLNTTLIDHDPVGASIHWLKKRPDSLKAVHGINASVQSQTVTRSWQLRSPVGTERMVIDTPAGIRGFELNDFITNTDFLLIPVIPSENDIHATTSLISELLLDIKIRTMEIKVGVIANRVKKNTKILEKFQRFLTRIDFPLVACLRDTQNYVNAASQGKGIIELYPPSLVKKDMADWNSVLDFIEGNYSGSEYKPSGINSLDQIG